MELEILNKLIVLVAKRGSGKSELLRYIVKLNEHLFDTVFCVCPTNEANGFYNDFIPKKNIFSKYSEHWINSLLESMKKLTSGKKDDQCKHVLLILDDACSQSNFHQSVTMKTLAANGRHYKITVIITTQFVNHIPPVVRQNCDYVAIGTLNTQGIKMLTDEYKVGKISNAQFEDMYYENTKDYNFLLIRNTAGMTNLSEGMGK